MSLRMIAAEWIMETLAADATLTAMLAESPLGGPGIYDTKPLEGAEFPYIVFSLDMDNSKFVHGVGARIIRLDSLWIIEAIKQCKGFDAVATIADEIQTALHRKSGAATGGSAECFLERPYEADYSGDGKEYRGMGGAYRIYAQED